MNGECMLTHEVVIAALIAHLCTVWDTLLGLVDGTRSVDTRSSLGGVTTKEAILVEDKYVTTSLVDGVCGTQTVCVLRS